MIHGVSNPIRQGVAQTDAHAMDHDHGASDGRRSNLGHQDRYEQQE